MNEAALGWMLFGVVLVAACTNDAAQTEPDAAAGRAGAAAAAAAGARGEGAGTTGSNFGGATGGLDAGTTGGTSTASASGASGQGTAMGGTSAGAGAMGGTSAGAGAMGGTSAGAGGAAGSAVGGGATGGFGGDASGSALPKRVLLYHFSTLVIDTVPAQLTLLKSELTTWGYEVEDSVNPDDISATNLARFGGVAMINTCFEPFGKGSTGDTQTAALKAFVENGGGLFGTHCAAVTFQSADPPNAYNALIGGRGGHGSFDGTSACRTIEQHPTTSMMPATFAFNGNLDNADYVADDAKVLVMCKWSSGDMKDTAVSWYRTPGKGRVFYTDFAKVVADLSDPTLGSKHILLGLGWVLGR